MGFSERDKLVALAIVHIFETSKPFGDYSAVAVLNDGAGVSYGVNQFTHRSGSLEAVLTRFHHICQRAGTQQLLVGYERKLRDRTALSIKTLSADVRFKNGLKVAGLRPEMQQAQREIAFENYLKPALDACEGSDFVTPMSLAVIYDSINHGSYERIRDRVVVDRPGNGSMKEIEFEKEWITRYVRKRDAWLESMPRLKATDYRTDFFLAQIARGNWNLQLPMSVHGFRLTESIFESLNPFAGLKDEEIEIILPAAEPQQDPPVELHEPEKLAANPAAEAPPIPPPAEFTPEKFSAFIPQIDTAKGYFRKLFAGTTIATAVATVAGLPLWVQIGLGVLLLTIVIGGVVMFIKYHDRIFDYVTNMNTLRAQPGTNDPVVTSNTPVSSL